MWMRSAVVFLGIVGGHVVAGADDVGVEESAAAPAETPPSPDGEALADEIAKRAAEESEGADDWKIEVDQFLADYLPSVVIEGPALNQPGDPIEIELPAIVVEAETDDARTEKRLPDRWEILSEEAKKEALAREHLTALETKVLNRWILWWGVCPEDYLLQREERERIQRQMDYNNDLLRTLEKVRPGVLDGDAD